MLQPVYCENTTFKVKSLVVGISGGIDSSVVSTLCALTNRKTIVLSMPIKQIMDRVSAETKVDELHEMYQHRSKSSSDSSSTGKARSRVMAPEKKSVSQNKYGYRDGPKADDEMKRRTNGSLSM